MNLSDIYANSNKTKQLLKSILVKRNQILAKGFVGSSLSFVVQELFRQADNPFMLVFNDKEDAAYHLNDLENLLNKKDVLFYPSSYRRPYEIEATDNANVLLRAEVLNRISPRKKPALIVTYADALFEKVVTKKQLQQNTLKLVLNQEISLDTVNETLFEYDFKRVDFVTEPGEFSVRGGILDVFSFSNDLPYRIEFFGDEIDSIRTFDIESQLSVNQLKNIDIIPNIANKSTEENRESFLEFVSRETIIFAQNTLFLKDRIEHLFEKSR